MAPKKMGRSENIVSGMDPSQNRRSNPETESSQTAEMQDATSTAPRIRMLIQRIIFCTTLKMSHDYGWRGSCAAGGVTAIVVGSGAWLAGFSTVDCFLYKTYAFTNRLRKHTALRVTPQAISFLPIHIWDIPLNLLRKGCAEIRA